MDADFGGLMPADVKAATIKLNLLRFLTGALAGMTVGLVLILIFVVLTGDPPAVMTAVPVFIPSPGIYEAGGNPREDWKVSGSEAVSAKAEKDLNQPLPDGVVKVTVYATSAVTPGQHRSSEVIDIFDEDKPCGNPCEQTKLAMTEPTHFYENSCMRAIAVGEGMVSSGITSGTYLVRAKPVTGFFTKPGAYSGLPGPASAESWGRATAVSAVESIAGWDPAAADGRYTTAPFIGFSTPYDVAPRHFEVIFTFTSREDVMAGYVCKTRKDLDSPYTLQPEPLYPTYLSGHPRWSPSLDPINGGPDGSTGDCATGETGLCECPMALREPTPVQPVFNVSPQAILTTDVVSGEISCLRVSGTFHDALVPERCLLRPRHRDLQGRLQGGGPGPK